MRSHRLVWFLALASMLASQPAAMAEAPLIPRALLFGNPQKYASVISPDAKWLSWIAPYKDVMNIWVAPLKHLDRAQPLTRESGHGISSFAAHVTWTCDSKHIVYMQDHDGDGNAHIYSVDIRDPLPRDLTPSDDMRAGLVGAASCLPGEAAISISPKAVPYADLYRLDLRNGRRRLLLKNAGYLSFLLDSHLVPRFAIRREPSNGETLVRLSDGSSFMTIPAGDVRTTRLLSISGDGRALFLLDSRGRNTTALARMDLATGVETILGEDPRADVQDVALDDKTYAPLFYAVALAHIDNRAVSSRVKNDLETLARQDIGDWLFNSQSRDGRSWKLSVFSSRNLSAWLYDRKKRQLRKLYDTRPALADAVLADMQAVTVASRAGQDLVSYLSFPPGSDSARKGIPDTPLPLVLVVHGGPHDRNSFGFDPVHQWLANRGYAVLSVNMRGSTGFGKAFLNASVGEWGTNLDDDLSDAVAWAVRNKIADPARIAIMGGSYGGYAVLRGMTRNPALYACGIDEFGPSDLLTLENPANGFGVSALYHNEVGDPSKPGGQEKMRDQSPLTHAAEMRSPLLVAQGANDPSVKPFQSERMVAAVKAAGVPVTYLFYPDEGHGFVRAENNQSFAGVAERFLARCLGGRFEPLTADEIKASSIEVKEGADNIPGLDTLVTAALAKPQVPR